MSLRSPLASVLNTTTIATYAGNNMMGTGITTSSTVAPASSSDRAITRRS